MIKKIKLYPDIDAKGCFELPENLSEQITNIYELIDSIPITEASILDDYYSGMLKTVETILATPIGQLHEKLEELLEEVHVNMQVNYDAEIADQESVEESRTQQTQEQQEISSDSDDISDEEMMKILPG
jgi:hypothetical protein